MAAMQTGLEGKPWWHGLLAGAVLLGVVMFLAWKLVLSGMSTQIERQEARLQELQQKISDGRTAQKNLPRFEEEVQALEQELEKLLQILPARRNTPDLLRRIRSLAERGDFAFSRFTPRAPTEKDFYSEWPISISLVGSYHNLAEFFDRVSRFRRIVNIDSLTITALQPKDATETRTISASFIAKTFIYKEPTAEDLEASASQRGSR